MADKEIRGRGGSGRGQGRKPLEPDEPTVEMTVTLPEGHLRLLDNLTGYGNTRSQKVRNLILRAAREQGYAA